MHLENVGPLAGISLGGNALRAGLVWALALALLGTESVPSYAQAAPTPSPAAVESQVRKFGAGKSVKVWLVGGEFITGHISSIGADSFTVKIGKKRPERAIPYAQVMKVKDPSPLTWILVGAAITILVIILATHH